jgi:glycine oxidase
MTLIDYIILGQGLAGSFLGYALISRQKSVLIFDTDYPNTASKVAAGIFNPITGQRMVLSWNAHRIFPFIDHYYRVLETVLNKRFYFPIGIYKPFQETRDLNDWMGKSSESFFIPFIKNIHQEGLYGHIIKDVCGGIELNQAGYVDTNSLLSAFKIFFENKKSYIVEKFDQTSLNLYEDKVIYHDYSAKKVIFCEGPSVVHNNYFNWLPFALVKGEILTLDVGELPEKVISKDIFLLPLGGTVARAGSTYERVDTSLKITVEAKHHIKKKLTSLLINDFKIIDQKVGIRPATKDRRPLMGLHPDSKLIGLFNGLGTKGVTLGPYYANQFADFIVFNRKFDREADLRRYI